MACSIRCVRVPSCVETRIINRILNRTGVGSRCRGGCVGGCRGGCGHGCVDVCGGTCCNRSNSRLFGGSRRCIEPQLVTRADCPSTKILQKLMLMAKEVLVFIGFNVTIRRESAILNTSQRVLRIVLFLFLLIICIFGSALCLFLLRRGQQRK
jgi:hypothetical protein